LIDPKLHESGWQGGMIKLEYAISVGRILNSNGNRTAPKRADYVLFYPDVRGPNTWMFHLHMPQMG